MKKILLTFVIVLPLSVSTLAADLPSCQNTYRHNCHSIITYFNGTQYNGEWQDNEFGGWGVFTAPGFYTYVGNFKAGKRNGLGTITYADGSIKAGIWQNFNLVKNYKNLPSYKDCLINLVTSDVNTEIKTSIPNMCLKSTMTPTESVKQK
jgi:hypothetical protein